MMKTQMEKIMDNCRKLLLYGGLYGLEARVPSIKIVAFGGLSWVCLLKLYYEKGDFGHHVE